jgi:hypothetical protein
VPLSVGKSLPWIVDSCHEIPGKSADSPEAGFNGKMMTPQYSIPFNHHTRNLRHLQRGIAPGVVPGGSKRRTAQHAPCLSSAKAAVSPTFLQHPLAKHGMLGQ